MSSHPADAIDDNRHESIPNWKGHRFGVLGLNVERCLHCGLLYEAFLKNPQESEPVCPIGGFLGEPGSREIAAPDSSEEAAGWIVFPAISVNHINEELRFSTKEEAAKWYQQHGSERGLDYAVIRELNSCRGAPYTGEGFENFVRARGKPADNHSLSIIQDLGALFREASPGPKCGLGQDFEFGAIVEELDGRPYFEGYVVESVRLLLVSSVEELRKAFQRRHQHAPASAEADFLESWEVDVWVTRFCEDRLLEDDGVLDHIQKIGRIGREVEVIEDARQFVLRMLAEFAQKVRGSTTRQGDPDAVGALRELALPGTADEPTKPGDAVGPVREMNASSPTHDVVTLLPDDRKDQSIDRRARVDAFLARCNRQPIETDGQAKIIRKHIWRAVGHDTSRQFEYWQKSSSKATTQDNRNFERILAMGPVEFIALLKKKSIL